MWDRRVKARDKERVREEEVFVGLRREKEREREREREFYQRLKMAVFVWSGREGLITLWSVWIEGEGGGVE